MPDEEVTLHIVQDHNGKKATFGPLQTDWLMEHGLIEHTGYQDTGPGSGVNFYKPLDGKTSDEIHLRVLAEPELRECDFCRVPAAPWRINVRPFRIRQGPTPAPFTRPVFCCEECVPFVRSNDKAGLMQRMIDQTIVEAERRGGQIAAHVSGLTPEQIKRGLGPIVKEFVTEVFAHRKGFPERA